MHATWAAHLILLKDDDRKKMLWRLQIMRLVIMQSTTANNYLVPFRPKYFSRRPVLKIPKSIFFLECEEQSSVPIQNNR
jgi:hypothetical protein